MTRLKPERSMLIGQLLRDGNVASRKGLITGAITDLRKSKMAALDEQTGPGEMLFGS